MSEGSRRGPALHTQILLGLVLGAAGGVAVNQWARAADGTPHQVVAWLLQYVLEPLSQVFLRLLLMTVVPLVFASLAVGVARLGAMGNLGRIGTKTMVFFVLSMALAVGIGLTLVNLVQPGVGLPEETRAELLHAYGGDVKDKTKEETRFGVDTFVKIVPRNPVESMARWPPDMLGVICFALLVGIGLTVIDRERSDLVVRGLEGVGDLMVVIINLAMKLAPYGVFAFLFIATARFGFKLLAPLGLYVLVVLAGLALQMFGVFSILVRLGAGLNPLEFFRRIRVVIVTAFSTSSSSATLPTSIKVAEEELGVPSPIAGFVLPLGATMNMNGTALFEGVTVVFLAQVYGLQLGMAEQAIVIVLSVLTAIGAAGVPGGSLPLLGLVLGSVGVPLEYLAIIIGVDRLLDMCRTTLNVVGDVACAALVARSEGFALLQPPPNAAMMESARAAPLEGDSPGAGA